MGELETKLTTKIINHLNTYKRRWVYKTSDRFSFGIPDILACIDGRFVALEVKKEENEEQAYKNHKARFRLQKQIINLIRKAGGISYVVYGFSGWLEIKNEIDKELKWKLNQR